MKTILNQADELSRRKFMSITAKTFLGVGMMPWLSHQSSFGMNIPGLDLGVKKATARNVIYLYMAGGMSHIDTFDPKPDSSFQGPVETIASNVDGIRVSEHLSGLANHMDKMAIIRSMTSTQGAHEEGNYFMHTSYAKRGTIQHPALGAWVSRLSGKTNPRLPGFVRVGGNISGSGFLGSKHAPLTIGKPEDGLKHTKRLKHVDDKEFKKRLDLANLLDTEFHKRYRNKEVIAYDEMYDDAITLMKSEDLKAFNIKSEPAEIRNEYGRNNFGQGCLLARRLVEHNVRFVEVTLGGWDSHNDNFVEVGKQAATLDQALSALLNDLNRRGLLDETLVVLSTEFGRTPRINQNNGRDHYPKAFSCALAGGGIQGGQVFGTTDENGANIESDKVEVPDFNATIAYALGLPLEETVYSPSGRPFKVAHDGTPLTGLF